MAETIWPPIRFHGRETGACGKPNISMADAPAEAMMSGESVVSKITLEKKPAIATAINAPMADMINSLVSTLAPLIFLVFLSVL